jgi:hypothetical protein
VELPSEKLKCNVDAVFIDNKVEIGICLRDCNGKFIKAKTMVFFQRLNLFLKSLWKFIIFLRKGIHHLVTFITDFEK